MGSLAPGQSSKLSTELSEAQKDAWRSKLVEIVSATANNCLSELGYYPGIKQNLAFLEDRCNSWQQENVKLYEDNRKLNKALQSANEQLALTRQALDLHQQPENGLMNEVVFLRSQVTKFKGQVDELQRQNAVLSANPNSTNAGPGEIQQATIAYARLYQEHQAALTEIHALRNNGRREISQLPSPVHPPPRTQSHSDAFSLPQSGSSTTVSAPRSSGSNTQHFESQMIRNVQPPYNNASPPLFYAQPGPPPKSASPGVPGAAPYRVVSGDLPTTYVPRAGPHTSVSHHHPEHSVSRPVSSQAPLNPQLSLQPSPTHVVNNHLTAIHTGQPPQPIIRSSRPQTAPSRRSEPRLSSSDVLFHLPSQSASVPSTPIETTPTQRTQQQSALSGSVVPVRQLPGSHSVGTHSRPSLSLPLRSLASSAAPQAQVVASPDEMSPSTPSQSAMMQSTRMIGLPTPAQTSPSITIPPTSESAPLLRAVDTPSAPQTSVTETISSDEIQMAHPEDTLEPMPVPSLQADQSTAQDLLISSSGQQSIQNSETPTKMEPGQESVDIAEEEGESEEEEEEEEECMEVDADGLRPIPYVLGLMFEDVGQNGRRCRFCMRRFNSGAIKEEPRPFINEDDSVLAQHCQEQHPNGWEKVRDPKSGL